MEDDSGVGDVVFGTSSTWAFEGFLDVDGGVEVLGRKKEGKMRSAMRI